VDFSQLTTWKDLALAAAPLITLVGVFYTGKIHLRGQAQARQIEHRKQQLQQFYGPALLQTERLLATRLMIITLRSEAEGDPVKKKLINQVIWKRIESDWTHEHRALRLLIVNNGWLANESTQSHFLNLLHFLERYELTLIEPQAGKTLVNNEKSVEEFHQDLSMHTKDLTAQLASGIPAQNENVGLTVKDHIPLLSMARTLKKLSVQETEKVGSQK
jgi:hypothetical protein